jgi:hypothetical protein
LSLLFILYLLDLALDFPPPLLVVLEAGFLPPADLVLRPGLAERPPLAAFRPLLDVRLVERVPFFAAVFLAVDFFAADFLTAVFFAGVFLAAPFFAAAFDRPPPEDDFLGTFAPSSRASERPMAMACFLDVTFLPLPLFSSPRFLSCMARSTFSPARFEYFAIMLILNGS